ncbi:MAG: Crp/Fnr family transcriptional regulator [Burkholderiales bacterium]|nr:Crp/Fnr family transcriptional regulator [Burkholderiales bacterium]
MDLSPLRAALHSLSPLGDEAWAGLEGQVTARVVAATEILLRAGDRASEVFFVRSGLLREYYVDGEGRETTRRFTQSGELSGSLADLLSGQPAMVWIEALEPAEIWRMEWARLDALAERNSDWMRLARALAEQLYLRKMQREFELLTLDAAQRYRRFSQQHPGLDARLPRQLVASYLGITPVHLSRIRASGKRVPEPKAPAQRRRSA